MMGWRCAAIVVLSLLTPLAAWADMRSDVLVAIGKCERLTDDRAWLDCLDTAAAPMRARLSALSAAAPAPPAADRVQSRAPSSPPPAAEAARRFGLPLPRVPRRTLAQRDAGVRARMSAYSFDRFGMFTVTLDNGQVWRQIPADTSVAHWSKPAAGYVAIVRNGALGSFNLMLEGEGGAYKVVRVK